ncbi:protoporphyrinogen oxidase-like protein [Candidatus Vecturithrix granuli]|uniref:Protoporphyrinogen oxidase-like protein n=1 Tax=Vecturithrix granuli TaxID=1499967 RepID=A0A0S6WAQ1_VECG1|nr:protoporphyrinogen oxidase-like protein [Candidatus Vecturithrix granuli]
MKTWQHLILGAGMTGLAAGYVSGLPIYEAADVPGGICASYYLKPGTNERLFTLPDDGEAYRFEIGGGHWIFGGDAAVRQFINRLILLKDYLRTSSVYFSNDGLYAPYPLQNHLRYLGVHVAAQALAEMARPQGSFRTMREWLEACFGPTLCQRFFFPFHERYTAGLYTTIAPQDAYKSPVDLSLAIQGALQEVAAAAKRNFAVQGEKAAKRKFRATAGYNATFRYPYSDLSTLARSMAQHCTIHYGKRAIQIDVHEKIVFFADGTEMPYNTIISTLPLNTMLTMTDIQLETPADPFTSVLVLNIGAIKGRQCPQDHWLYIPDARSRFHRVGLYSNVDPSFLPKSRQIRNDRISLYIERAYSGGVKPTDHDMQQYIQNVVAELQKWQFIEEVEVCDPTWVEAAYTWAYPGSCWKDDALQALEKYGIYQVGRYGRWQFQGIADSIRDGFIVGASLK